MIVGHTKPLEKRPNIRNEIARIRHDPMRPLLEILNPDDLRWVSSRVTRYEDAYQNYYLSLHRFLKAMPIVIQYRNGPYYVRTHGGKYSPAEKRIADAYREIRPFFDYDLKNCLIHARILLDRVAALAATFLIEGNRPSFRSFSDHKKFFVRNPDNIGTHQPYADYIRTKTPWFEMPLKAVRDDYVVHSGGPHVQFAGFSNNYEIQLSVLIPTADNGKSFASIQWIAFSPLQLSYQIESLLTWFSEYARHHIQTHPVPHELGA